MMDPSKNRRLAAFCEENKYDGVLLVRRANIAWIADGADVHVDAGSERGIAAILWTPERRIVLTDNIEAARLRDEEFSSSDGWEIIERPWWQAPALHDLPAWLGNSWAADRRLVSDLHDDPIAALRFSLTPAEQSRVRELGSDAAEVMEQVLFDVDRGMSEHGVAGAMAGGLRKRGIACPVLLVAADDRIARFRHPIPTTRSIERVIMVAICAQRRGLIVSMTRLMHFGPLCDDMRRRHAAVCHVDATLHAHTTVGACWGDIFRAAVATYEAEGFADEWHKHHQGGPMGYAARDFKVTASETRKVRPRQLVGWNPSITGTKSEDTVLAAADPGVPPEVVTKMPQWPLIAAARPGHAPRPDILMRQ